MLFKALKALLMMLPQSTCYHVLKDRLVSVSRFRQSSFGSSAWRAKHPLSSTTADNSTGIGSATTTRMAGATKLATSASAMNQPSSLSAIKSTRPGLDVGGAGSIYLSRVLEVRAVHCETAWIAIRSESLVVPSDLSVRDDIVGDNGEKTSSRRDWLGYASEAEEAAAHEARRQQVKSPVERDPGGEPHEYSDLSALASAGEQNGANEATESAKEESHGALGPDSESCQDENCEWKTYWEGSREA